MSKLFNLREWLTVAEAARHLSTLFGEEVTEADVLRLALDGHLRLSVNFVNHTKARCGKVVGYDEAEWREFPAGEWIDSLPNVPEEAKGKPLPYMYSLNLDDKRYLNLSDEITTLRGVWDLPMIGSEQLEIEHKYQNMTDGPAVTLQCLEGAFVESQDGEMCLLQEGSCYNNFQSGLKAKHKKLKQRLTEMMALEPSPEGATEDEDILNPHEEDQKIFLEKRRKQSAKESYFPAFELPNDAVIVVRTQALRNLEQSMNGASPVQDKPLFPNERNTLLTIIAALCEDDTIKHQERDAAGRIAELTEKIGAPVDRDTVKRHLKKIPDALGSRMK